MGALIIGLAPAGLLPGGQPEGRIGYDDSLDVVGVHFVGGIVGALLTGVLASTAINAFGDGSIEQLGKQAVAVGVTAVFSFVGTLSC